ncbi:hypothetical protein [Hyalangium versicolor]|uniref:hypothetical protein n=1 Tax=Hyalangium versicolor TaxID=2861190 RepID=UPI001CCEE337|nr:hypothetical protein [Hyalangium versicolor]
MQDVQRLSGRRVRVVGTYHQVDMRMKPKPPAQYRGHAAVRLGDGTDILLEPGWSKAAIRSQAERERHDGKHVEIIGVLHEQSPAPPEPAAYVVGPALSPVESIQLAP